VKLHSLLTEDLVLLDMKAPDKDKALSEMAAFLKKKDKVGKEKDLFEKLLQREGLGSTAIGEGFAIPHCKVKGIKKPVLMLGISKPGITFDSIDGKLTHVFFLVISSPDSPSQNLQILAAVAQLVRKAPTLQKRLLEAHTPQSALKTLREEEEKPND